MYALFEKASAIELDHKVWIFHGTVSTLSEVEQWVDENPDRTALSFDQRYGTGF